MQTERRLLNSQVEVTMDTDVDSLVERFKDRVNYDAIHAACYKRAGASHSYLSNWKVISPMLPLLVRGPLLLNARSLHSLRPGMIRSAARRL